MIDGLYHVVLGSGRPFLVMHGGLGWDHTYLRPWFDPLARLTQLTYYDHRGNGRSAEPRDWATVTHATWVDDAERLRKHLYGNRRMVLFGHSHGALLALEYALRYPEHLDGLILCCATPHFDTAEAAVARAYARAAAAPQPEVTRRALDAILAGPPPDDAALAAALRDLLPIYVHHPAEVDLDALTADMKPRAAAFRRSFYELLPAFDVRGRLHEITVPTLVLSGRHDWAFPPEEGPARLLEHLPNGQGHVFEQSGHLPFAEEPEAFIRVVSSWMSQLSEGIADTGAKRNPTPEE